MTAVGLLTIGQSPRPDLSGPLRAWRPDLHFIEAGALDHLTMADLPTPTGPYPLKTRLRDGAHVPVDSEWLAPRLQRALQRLEMQDVAVTMLMCAGSFADLTGARPLLKPFDLVLGLLRAAGVRRFGVICPFVEQEEAIRTRWLAADLDAHVGTADLTDASSVEDLVSAWTCAAFPVECIVLDYVGHEPAQVALLQKQCRVPVFDLGLITMTALAAIIPKETTVHYP